MGHGATAGQRANPGNTASVIQGTGLQYTGPMSTSPDFTLFGGRLTTSLSLGKTDNTLETNKSRSENLRASSAYTFPGDVRTNLSFSESRSETGVTRSSADTAKAELSKRRNRSLSASLTTKIHGFNVRSSQSWSEGLNTNTANADNDPRNRFYARDRESERWKAAADTWQPRKPVPPRTRVADMRGGYGVRKSGPASFRQIPEPRP